jgi:hypothetical protein
VIAEGEAFMEQRLKLPVGIDDFEFGTASQGGV